MGFFQRAPRTPEEVESARLPIPPEEVAEMDEAEWYEKAYRGDAPQLTVRAVAMGAVLGFLLAFTNLYIGLKTGWHLGVAITACILSYVFWNGLLKIGVARTPMSILENNCMQSTASAAGYSTGGTFVSALAALLMLSVTPDHPRGEHLPWTVYASWTVFLAVLGVVLAIPMKRNLINREKLKFPSGTAAAVTLQSLYSHGDEALKKGRALLWAALYAGLWKVLISLQFVKTTVVDPATGAISHAWHTLLPEGFALFDKLGMHVPGYVPDRSSGAVLRPARPSDWTLTWDNDPVMIAAGMLVGLRIAIWMVVGGILLPFALGPAGLDWGWTGPDGQMTWGVSHPGKAWKEIGIWFGVPIMVASGLLSFAFQWRTIGRAFRGLGGGGETAGAPPAELVKRTEVPFSWFAIGVLVSGAGILYVANHAFGIPYHYGAIAVALTFVLALVACRATGESDITPTGAMGKLMQLTFGILMPQSTTANLMSAGITAGAASSSADLLNDLKSGYLLGANPRRQFLAQALGIVSGTVATVAGFYWLVPDASALTPTTDPVTGAVTQPEFAAPAAQAWMAVAEVFARGFENMHPMHREFLLWGLLLGTAIVLAETFLPRWKRILPSATGLGLGLILPFQYPLSMLLGAILAEVWRSRRPESAQSYLVPVSAGIIAGVSILGVAVAVLNAKVFTE